MNASMCRWTLPVVVAALGTGVACAAPAAADYLGVVAPKVDSAPAVVAQVCANCHGADGVAIAPVFPNLAGQNYNYLLKSLEAFRDGTWDAATMKQMVTTIPTVGQNRILKQIAAWFSQRELHPASGAQASQPKPDQTLVEAGYTLYFQGKRDADVPACAACHLASGLGNAPMAVPRLAGQNAPYLVSQLKAFAAGTRHTSPGGVMATIAARLSDQQMQAVATYVHEMRPDLLPGSGPGNFEAYDKALKDQPVAGVPASALAAPGDSNE